MRLTIKRTFIVFLLLLASSLLLTHGCGGKSSGGCPNNTAPSNATISAPTSLGTPHNAGGDCYPLLGFTVKDVNGIPMNGVCVEIFSNGLIALASGPPTCANVNASSPNAIVTRTDNNGTVLVEMVTLPTTTGGTSFVEVSSGAINAVATTPPTVD
ncbi:MAG TPA: hypothetical protein VEI57_13235 [Nitrospirota bacterium]|nr:hypothetical protein [Nitrospirota bacterium]